MLSHLLSEWVSENYSNALLTPLKSYFCWNKNIHNLTPKIKYVHKMKNKTKRPHFTLLQY